MMTAYERMQNAKEVFDQILALSTQEGTLVYDKTFE